MEVLYYNELDFSKVKKQFDKTVNYLKAGDFHSADVKKMPNAGYYRAKLDDTNLPSVKSEVDFLEATKKLLKKPHKMCGFLLF